MNLLSLLVILLGASIYGFSIAPIFGFGWPDCGHPLVCVGRTVLALVSIGHDTYSAGALVLWAIHVPFMLLHHYVCL